MKIFLLVPIALMIFVAAAIGDSAYDDDTIRILQKTPTLSKEEMKQVLFSASFLSNYSPGTIGCALYNPCRDKSIRGIVINIHSKDASSGQEQGIDLFINIACGPLQCTNNQQTFTILAETAKNTPVITLKEVHYPTPDQTNTADAQDSPEIKQKSPVVVQVLADGTFKIGETLIKSEDLSVKLEELAKLPGKPTIIMKADNNVPYNKIVEMLDACRKAGLTQIAFSTTSFKENSK